VADGISSPSRGSLVFPGSPRSGGPRPSRTSETYIPTLALQVLVITTLAGTALDVGLLNGARWLPYLVLGLVPGAVVERVRVSLCSWPPTPPGRCCCWPSPWSYPQP